MPSVIFIGPHPDDIELGCGGTIAYFVRKDYNVICIFVTNGGHLTQGKLRKKESIKACISLGVLKSNIYFGKFKDTCIPVSFEVISFLEKFYFDCKDDLWGVFIPSQEDSHQDHRAVYSCCISAFRRSPRIYTYQSPSTFGSFNPTTYIDISGFLRKKKKSLYCHKSQIARKKIYTEYESILNIAKYHAQQLGVKYAEAFQTVRNLIKW
jgi:LmbE family N-acetylglucosaminyl deacetylase